MQKLFITKIPKFNTLVIKQKGGNFFLASKDSIVIDIYGLSLILKFLVMNKYISHRILEGILDEFNSTQS
jgi:hypothetical protein